MPGHVVVSDGGHAEVVACCQLDGQLAKPGGDEVLHHYPDFIRSPVKRPLKAYGYFSLEVGGEIRWSLDVTWHQPIPSDPQL
jgi:hypothetical protein